MKRIDNSSLLGTSAEEFFNFWDYPVSEHGHYFLLDAAVAVSAALLRLDSVVWRTGPCIPN